jgi:hypothetical protein
MLIIFQVCITASPSPTRLASAIAISADALSSRGLVNLHHRYLKTCMAFGTCALFLLLLSGSAILQYASVVESNFLLLAFVLVLAVTFLHLSTSPIALQHERSFRANGSISLPSSVSPATTQNSNLHLFVAVFSAIPNPNQSRLLYIQ